jgi:hypothetical protein
VSEGTHFAVLGKVLEPVMEVDLDTKQYPDVWTEAQKRLSTTLSKYGLTYHVGGMVIVGPPAHRHGASNACYAK